MVSGPRASSCGLSNWRLSPATGASVHCYRLAGQPVEVICLRAPLRCADKGPNIWITTLHLQGRQRGSCAHVWVSANMYVFLVLVSYADSVALLQAVPTCMCERSMPCCRLLDFGVKQCHQCELVGHVFTKCSKCDKREVCSSLFLWVCQGGNPHVPPIAPTVLPFAAFSKCTPLIV